MIMPTYWLLASLATLLSAVGCWPAVAVIGAIIIGLIFRPEIAAFLGSLRAAGVLPERRAAKRRERIA